MDYINSIFNIAVGTFFGFILIELFYFVHGLKNK